MSDTPDQPLEPVTAGPSRKRWQVGLRTLFLVVIAFAVWMTVFTNRRSIETLEKRVATLRPMARELVIDDPSRIAVVKMEELWYDENQWEIYLPPGQYRLCIATHEIDQDGFGPVVKSGLIGGGRHRLALEQREVKSGWRVVVTSDGAELLAVEELKEWDEGSGSTGGGEYSISTQPPASQPVVLFRRRFSKRVLNGNGSQSSTPQGPTEGLMLWIERVAGSKAGP